MILMNEVSLHHYLLLSFILFCIGLFGVLVRRNLLIILISIELMLNAINLIFVSASQYYGHLDGQIMSFFVMIIASAEAGVGLSIAVQIYRRVQTTNSQFLNKLKG